MVYYTKMNISIILYTEGDTPMSESKILLESGTNELEIIEFGIDNGTFGINVAKVREIISPYKIAVVPNTHHCIEGIFQLREQVMPLIDLSKYLNLPPSPNPSGDKFIVTQFNQIYTAFRVHSVSRIHRISWGNIEAPTTITTNHKGVVTGVIKMDGRIILLLDFEKIVYDIAPATGMMLTEEEEQWTERSTLRSQKRVLLAEDSDMLRTMIIDVLSKAGYQPTFIFKNGLDACEYMESIAREPANSKKRPDLVITDIEMPQMDGHHLTKRIRDTKGLEGIPIIIFSSLINDAMRHKGLSVGASAQISKPEIGKLVHLLDHYLLNE